MKAFRFKLERILALRKYREQEWELKLGRITGECVQLRRDIEDRANRVVGELRLRNQGTPDSNNLLTSHLYTSRLEQEAEKKRKELAASERLREKIQKDYLAASRDRKVLDKLKDRRSAGYLKEQRVEEVKQIDDINIVLPEAGRSGNGVTIWPDME